MNSITVLLILIGAFIILNSTNLVGVFKGDKRVNIDLSGSSTTTKPNDSGGTGGNVGQDQYPATTRSTSASSS